MDFVRRDEKRLAIIQISGAARPELWTLEISSGILSRQTFGDQEVARPVWAPDSSRVAFSADSAGEYELREVMLGGGGPRRIYSDREPKHLDDWTRDGRFLVYHVHQGNGGYIGLLSGEGERKPLPFLRGQFAKVELAQTEFPP